MSTTPPTYAGGPAPNQDLVTVIGVIRAQAEINDRKVDPRRSTYDSVTGCWLTTSGVRVDGYGSAKMYTNDQLRRRQQSGDNIRNRGINILLHRLALFTRTGVNPSATASHLCNRKACFEGTHIVDESHSMNLSRKHCRPAIYCEAHDNIFYGVPCVSHTPPCIEVIRVPACCSRPAPSPPTPRLGPPPSASSAAPSSDGHRPPPSSPPLPTSYRGSAAAKRTFLETIPDSEANSDEVDLLRSEVDYLEAEGSDDDDDDSDYEPPGGESSSTGGGSSVVADDGNTMEIDDSGPPAP